MFNSSAIVKPLGLNVKKKKIIKILKIIEGTPPLERDNTKLSVESKEGQALIGILLGDGWLSRNKSKITGILYNTRLGFSPLPHL